MNGLPGRQRAPQPVTTELEPIENMKARKARYELATLPKRPKGHALQRPEYISIPPSNEQA